MGDIDGTDRSDVSRIVGADLSTGEETTPVGSTLTGDLQTTDIINTDGAEGEMTVGLTAVPIRVGVSNLPSRKIVTAQPKDNEIYWGYTASVTTTTGTRLFKNQFAYWRAGPSKDIYLIGNAAGLKVSITEGA